MRRDYLFHSFFLACFLLIIYQFLRILEPFVTPILGAVVLCILALPLHHWLRRRMPKRSGSFRAALSTILVTVVVVAPFLLICWIAFNEAQVMAPVAQNWRLSWKGWSQGNTLLALPWMRSLQKYLMQSVGLGRMEFDRYVIEAGQSLLAWISESGRSLARNAVLSLGNLAVMIFTLFFLLRDGEAMLANLKRLIPMRLEHKDRMAERLRVTVTEIVRGSVLTAIFQTFCATAGYLIFRVPAAVTLGIVTGAASFIPIVGTALVWLPLGFFYFTKGLYVKAILLWIWGAVVISTFDNLLRSFLIGRNAELPLLFLFFSILGGAELYGLKGLLLGPLLVAIIPVFVDIYRDQYLRKEIPEASENPDEHA